MTPELVYIITTVTAVLSAAVVTGAIHLTWFKSTLPILVFKFLRLLGWKRKSEENYMAALAGEPDKGGFWPNWAEYKFWTRPKWVEWSEKTLWFWVSELLDCPWCLAWHVSFWVTAVFTAARILPLTLPVFAVTVCAGVVTCALLARILKYDDLD
jgi:hypothetical protein